MRTIVRPDDRWALTVATEFSLRVRAKPNLRVVLPTGLTMAPVYERLAAAVDWSGVTILLLDEFGGLSPDDPGRCDSMLRRDLLDRIDQSRAPHAVEFVDPENPPPADWPTNVDLALVGIGSNGHIGMNEPPSRADSPTRRVDLAQSTSQGALRYGARRAPTWGVTIGIAPLLAAREVWLLATGRSKAAIVERAIHGEITDDVPASHLQRHANVLVFVDEAARPFVPTSSMRGGRG